MLCRDQLGGVKTFVIFPLPILTLEGALIGGGANPEMGVEEHVLATTYDLIADGVGAQEHQKFHNKHI